MPQQNIQKTIMHSIPQGADLQNIKKTMNTSQLLIRLFPVSTYIDANFEIKYSAQHASRLQEDAIKSAICCQRNDPCQQRAPDTKLNISLTVWVNVSPCLHHSHQVLLYFYWTVLFQRETRSWSQKIMNISKKRMSLFPSSSPPPNKPDYMCPWTEVHHHTTVIKCHRQTDVIKLHQTHSIQFKFIHLTMG